MSRMKLIAEKRARYKDAVARAAALEIDYIFRHRGLPRSTLAKTIMRDPTFVKDTLRKKQPSSDAPEAVDAQLIVRLRQELPVLKKVWEDELAIEAKRLVFEKGKTYDAVAAKLEVHHVVIRRLIGPSPRQRTKKVEDDYDAEEMPPPTKYDRASRHYQPKGW